MAKRKYKEDPRVSPLVGGPSRKGRKLAEIAYLKKKGKHLSKGQKKFAKHEKRAAKREKNSDTSSMKIQSGKKYTRLQRFQTLDRDQKKILKEFSQYHKPEKFKETKELRKAQKFLQRGMEQGIPRSPADIAGENFVQAGLMHGAPQSSIEPQAQNFLQNILGRTPEQQLQTFEAPYLRQFQEHDVPTIAERFAGQDALESSGFQQTMGQAASGLRENLAALKGNLINQLLGQQTQAASVGLGYAQLPGQRYQLQQQMANLGLGYGQLGDQRYDQQRQSALTNAQMSLLPQDVQRSLNQYAENADFQRQQQVLGTQPWGYMGVPPRGRQPGFWQGVAPRAIGALAGAGIGALTANPGAMLAGAGKGALLGSSIAGGGANVNMNIK